MKIISNRWGEYMDICKEKNKMPTEDGFNMWINQKVSSILSPAGHQKEFFNGEWQGIKADDVDKAVARAGGTVLVSADRWQQMEAVVAAAKKRVCDCYPKPVCTDCSELINRCPNGQVVKALKALGGEQDE